MKIRVKGTKTAKSAGMRWAATGTLAACTAFGGRSLSAQETTGSFAPVHTPSTAVRQRLEISPGPLSDVVARFETITGLEISTPEASVRDLPSPGASGELTAEEALAQLLAGTGVDYRFTAPTTVALELRHHESVFVTERATLASPKYTEPLRDTPQSISVVPREVLEEQGVATLRDALRNVSGISIAAGEAGAQGDNLTVRGFSARNDLFIDGMRDFGSYYRDPFDTEEVQVLQGPSSVTFGRGSTGGVVNQQTKAPRLDRAILADAQLGTDETKRLTLDVNTPVPALGKGGAFRLNAMADDAGVAGRDVAHERRFGIAPSLSLGLGTETRGTLGYMHQSADDTPDYGLPWFFGTPVNVDRSSYYGFADRNRLKTEADIATARVEHDLGANLTLRNQARYAHYHRDALITEPQFASSVKFDTPLDTIDVVRRQIATESVESFAVDQLDATARLRTGGVAHTLVGGVEMGHEASSPDRFNYTGVPSTKLLAPTPGDAFQGTATLATSVDVAADSVAVYALDTIKVGDKVELIGGIRWDRFSTDYAQSVAPAASFTRVDEKATWRGAAVYKPTTNGSVYASAGTSFNPSAESLSLTAGNANVDPESNRTYEVGSKWDLSGGRLSVRGAIFRTEKINARETDPTNAALVVLAGNQRVDGLQIEARGQLTSGWDVQASYARLDSKVVSSRFFPNAVGASLANVPKNTFTFWTSVHLPRKWELALGANFVSQRTASSTVPFDAVTGRLKALVGYGVWNAMVKRTLTPRLDVQVNVENVTDKFYYDQLHPAHVVPGPGRSATLDLKVKL